MNVFSLAGRWPPFDYVHHSRYSYIRISSPDLIRANYVDESNQGSNREFVIIPTDDERLKIIIIPAKILP